jgi:hypothetical protein
MLLNPPHKSKYYQNWRDDNKYNSTEGQYLSYFESKVIPNGRRIKNQKVISRIQQRQNGIVEPKKSVSTSILPKVSKGKSQEATDSSIPDDLLMKARMVEASRIYYESGIDDAQNYLNKNKINYTIEPRLSSEISTVLIDNVTGETVISYRGTDVNNSKDLITDALALFGKERSSPEYGEVTEQLEAVERLYGTPKELIGFSRGSVLSMNLGDEFDIPTTQFNPLISPSLVKGQEEGSTHTIFRTLNDPISILARGKTANSKWTIRSILPLKDTISPMEEHYLKQFLSNDSPRRTSIEELLNTRIQTQGAKVSEYTMMKEMLTFVEKQASFIDYMKAVNPADANLSQTSRVYEGSNYTELWKDLGGSFSPEEAHAISQNEIGAVRAFETTRQERTSYSSLDPAQRQDVIDTAMENMQNTLETSFKFGTETNAVREEMVRQTTLAGTPPEISAMLVDALHPVSQIKGLAGGIAGFEEAALIDKLSGGALGGAGTATLGGALGAVNTSLASAALAGSAESLTAAALLPEIVAGAGGAIAGYETQQAVAQALKDAGANEETIKSVSAITGGAVGGATTAAIGVGATVGAAALTGGEFGAFLAPETAGLSVAIGLGLGAVFGAGTYVAGEAEDFGSALIESIKNPVVDPYYVGPAPMTTNFKETMDYLNKQEAADALRKQDELAGITPQQRVDMNNQASVPVPP